MPIKQAGPFSNSADSFSDSPASAPTFSLPTFYDRAKLPVNCANYSGASFWRWRYLYISQVDTVAEYLSAPLDAESVSQDFINDDNGFEGEGLFFAYQAAQEFTLTGSYAVTVGAAHGVSVGFQIFLRGSTLLMDFDAINISGTFSVILPATTVPKSVNLVLNADGSGVPANATANITIDLNPSS